MKLEHEVLELERLAAICSNVLILYSNLLVSRISLFPYDNWRVQIISLILVAL